MTIISISLTHKLFQELDELKDDIGFSGRSEVIRTNARILIEDYKEKKVLIGYINNLLLFIHKQQVKDKVTEIKDDFEDIIKTQLHSHLKEKKCMELFLLEGDAQRIIEFAHNFHICRKLDSVKLLSI